MRKGEFDAALGRVRASQHFSPITTDEQWAAVQAADDGPRPTARVVEPHKLTLHSEQETLDPKQLEHYRKLGSHTADDMGGVPQLVAHKGRIVVADGHHRLAVARERKEPLEVDWYET